jgi:hypothetical protein
VQVISAFPTLSLGDAFFRDKGFLSYAYNM